MAKRFEQVALSQLNSVDNPEKRVENALKKADNFITSTIAKLKSELIDAEIDLEDKKDRLLKAKYSTKWLDNPSIALSDIDSLKNQVETAEERIKDLNYSISEREQLLAEYMEEV